MNKLGQSLGEVSREELAPYYSVSRSGRILINDNFELDFVYCNPRRNYIKRQDINGRICMEIYKDNPISATRVKNTPLTGVRYRN